MAKRLNIKHSEETKRKISKANKGRVFTEEWKKNLSLAHKGQVSWRKSKRFVPLEEQRKRRLEYRRGWRTRNRDKVLELSRDYYKRNAEKMRRRSRDFYWQNRDKELSRVRYKKYGITHDEYFEILKNQQNRCAVCGDMNLKNLSVDHDHITGKVRGIICNPCNLALGNAKDSPIILRALASYLDNYEQTRT